MSNEEVSIPTRASGLSPVYIQDIGVRMNHDELLQLLTPTITYSPWARIKYPNKIMNAIRAVVELHKPEKDGLICGECSASESEWYPCPTIKAIEKELFDEARD